VSDKVNEDGTLTPYELNINYLDALDDPKNPIRDAKLISQRFLASQAIMLSLPGVPGIYFHSLFGSHGWREGVRITGQPRTINRQKLEADDLERELEDTESLRNSIYQGYARLLTSRVASPAFHPAGPGQILFLDPKIFTILRISPDRGVHVICLHNVSDRTLNININLRSLPIKPTDRYIDMSSGSQYFPTDFSLDVAIGPYEVVWLRGSEN
jgi:sucrose phosphorylase